MRHWKEILAGALAILVVSLLTSNAIAQQRQDTKRQHFMQQQSPDTSSRHGIENPTVIFKRVEEAIAQGNVDLLANHLGPKVFVSVSNDRSGYYSANQAYYILQGYFNLHQPASIRFNSYGDIPTNPYAVGIYSYSGSQGKGSAQIYVSLSLIQNTWKIDQITITNR